MKGGRRQLFDKLLATVKESDDNFFEFLFVSEPGANVRMLPEIIDALRYRTNAAKELADAKDMLRIQCEKTDDVADTTEYGSNVPFDASISHQPPSLQLTINSLGGEVKIFYGEKIVDTLTIALDIANLLVDIRDLETQRDYAERIVQVAQELTPTDGLQPFTEKQKDNIKKEIDYNVSEIDKYRDKITKAAVLIEQLKDKEYRLLHINAKYLYKSALEQYNIELAKADRLDASLQPAKDVRNKTVPSMIITSLITRDKFARENSLAWAEASIPIDKVLKEVHTARNHRYATRDVLDGAKYNLATVSAKFPRYKTESNIYCIKYIICIYTTI